MIAAIFAYALAAIAVDPLSLNGDAALHIEAAERILDGGTPSVDAIDTNEVVGYLEEAGYSVLWPPKP